MEAATEDEPAGVSVVLEVTSRAATASMASRAVGRGGSGFLATALSTCSCLAVSAAVAGALASLRARCRSRSSRQATGAKMARAFSRLAALSSCRLSYWQPVLRALKNSSITQRAR